MSSSCTHAYQKNNATKGIATESGSGTLGVFPRQSTAARASSTLGHGALFSPATKQNAQQLDIFKTPSIRVRAPGPSSDQSSVTLTELSYYILFPTSSSPASFNIGIFPSNRYGINSEAEGNCQSLFANQ